MPDYDFINMLSGIATAFGTVGATIFALRSALKSESSPVVLTLNHPNNYPGFGANDIMINIRNHSFYPLTIDMIGTSIGFLFPTRHHIIHFKVEEYPLDLPIGVTTGIPICRTDFYQEFEMLLFIATRDQPLFSFLLKTTTLKYLMCLSAKAWVTTNGGKLKSKHIGLARCFELMKYIKLKTTEYKKRRS